MKLNKNLAALMLSCLVFACNSHSEAEKKTSKQQESGQKSTVSLKITTPSQNKTFLIGEKIPIEYQLSSNITVDSIALNANNSASAVFYANTPVEWNSDSAKTGINNLRLIIYSDTLKLYASVSITLLASKAPELLSYKIKNTFPHDPKAYTQGLFFEEGFLYESTGQYGESSLRKIELETGEVVKRVNMSVNDFGEGIVKFKNRIYQLTWEERKGYVYDFDSFSLLYEFPYSTEGWGIDTDGTNLIVSNGSNKLYFLNPENFSEVKTLEVFDNKTPIIRLNELEFYDNKIWANVYGQDYIITICPHTGQVLQKIDFEGILSKQDQLKYRVDVLNGIAWDKTNKRLFITGKYWPKLFEVEIVKK